MLRCPTEWEVRMTMSERNDADPLHPMTRSGATYASPLWSPAHGDECSMSVKQLRKFRDGASPHISGRLYSANAPGLAIFPACPIRAFRAPQDAAPRIRIAVDGARRGLRAEGAAVSPAGARRGEGRGEEGRQDECGAAGSGLAPRIAPPSACRSGRMNSSSTRTPLPWTGEHIPGKHRGMRCDESAARGHRHGH